MNKKNEFNQVSDQSHPSLTTSNEHSAPSLNENGYNNLHWNGVKFTWHNTGSCGCMRDLFLSNWEKTFAYHHSPMNDKAIVADQNGDFPGKQTANQLMNLSLKTYDQKNPNCRKRFCIPQNSFLSNMLITSLAGIWKVGFSWLLDNSTVLSFLERFGVFSFRTNFFTGDISLRCEVNGE